MLNMKYYVHGSVMSLFTLLIHDKEKKNSKKGSINNTIEGRRKKSLYL